MQPSQAFMREDATGGYRATSAVRCSLPESEMRPVLVIIEQVRRHQPFEMLLIQDDHVVQQVASATSHPALRNPVLPRTAKGRASWLASHVPHSRKHLVCLANCNFASHRA
jgi:hypothetical protein